MASSVKKILVRFWLLLSAVFFTALAGAAMADIENTATAQASYGSSTLLSLPSSQSVPVAEGVANIRLTKVIDRVEDVNENGVTDEGDIVHYIFEVYNAGNLTLEEITVSDPLAQIAADTVGPLLPRATDATLTATYVLTQEDIDAGGFENTATALAAVADDATGTPRDAVEDISDAGDETVETPSLAGLTDDDPTNDPTVLLIDPVYDLSLAKSLVESVNIFPYVYDITYRFEVSNTGTVTAQNLQLQDDLFSQLDDAQIISAEVLEVSGFGGTGALNGKYDGNLNGAGDAAMLSSGSSLAPNEVGVLVIRTRVEFSPESFTDGTLVLENLAEVSATGILDAVGSYDPSTSEGGTPDATLVEFRDADGDGAPDGNESLTQDRDGDGIADAYDYDPTGYFYCEETGDILSGGTVTVVNASGSSADVRMLADGTNGYFQWFATAPGTYTMTYTLPPNSTASEDRLVSQAPLVLASLPFNPTSIGSSEFGGSGVLADFSAAANPYYETFVIGEMDPHVLNINIPVRFCGTPILSAAKTVTSDPVVQGDGRSALTYELTVGNVGTSRATDVNLTDDLDATFGAGRYEIVSLELTAAPEDFAGRANADFDGSSDQALLAGDGVLNADEEATVTLALLVSPEQSGTFTNTVTATGSAPRDGSALTPATASVDVELVAVSLQDVLLVTKSVNPSRARIGDVVTFTISVENTSDTALGNLTLVDSLPQGLAYRPDTGTLRGEANEPTLTGRTLRWAGLEVDAGETVVATVRTVLTSRAEVGVLTNQAWVADATSGERVTLVAEATVEVIAEAVFQCSDVIGRVFDDRNMNGFQDGAPDIRALVTDQEYVGGKFDVDPTPAPTGAEEGLPNARLVTPTGTVITTDEYGRYSVPCAELPQRAGSNFTLKLDTRSLPSGFRVTTENPRTMRVTPGIFTEMNFGAATGREIDIDLTAAAFTPRGEASEALTEGLAQLLRQAADTPSVVRINYYRDGESAQIARERLDVTEELIEDLWKEIGNYELIIERTVARFE